MSLGVAAGLCSDGQVSHLRMSLPRYGGCVKKHERVNAFNLVYLYKTRVGVYVFQ